MSRAVRRTDFPGTEGHWKAEVGRRLREQFSTAASGPHEPPSPNGVTIEQLLARPPETLLIENGGTVPAIDSRTGNPVAVGTLIFEKA